MTDHSKLFRDKAIDSFLKNLSGEVVIRDNRNLNKYIYVILAIGIMVTLMLGLYNINTYSTVPGILKGEYRPIKINSEFDGYVLEILVKNGEYVTEGQKVAILRSNNLNAEGNTYNEIQRDIFKEEYARLLQKEDTVKNSYSMSNNIIRDRISAQLALCKSLQLESKNLNDKFNIQKRLLDKKISLGDLISEVEVENEKLKMLSLQSEILANEQAITQSKLEVKSLESEQRLNKENFDIQTSDVISEQRKVKFELNNLSNLIEHVIEARASGYISNLNVNVGDAVKSGETIFLINKSNSDIETSGEIYIDSSSIGFVAVGNEVKIKVDAYPYRIYGTFMGVIESVDIQPSIPSEWDKHINTQNPVYIAKVKMNNSEKKIKGRDIKLKSGMTFQADIILGKESMIGKAFSFTKDL